MTIDEIRRLVLVVLGHCLYLWFVSARTRPLMGDSFGA
jgi:hypothetical protein